MLIERSVAQYFIILSTPFVRAGVSSVYGYQLELARLNRGPVQITEYQDMQGFNFAVEAIFRCFIPIEREVLIGIVHYVNPLGCMIEYGPARRIYLIEEHMGAFIYDEENESIDRFIDEDLQIIQVGSQIRFRIIAVRYDMQERDFIVECSIGEIGLGLVNGL